MSLADKIAAVAKAERDCIVERQAVDAAWARLKFEFRRIATPLRILVSGFSLGVASGIGLPGTRAASSAGGRFLTGPLVTMLLESVVPGLVASFTAATVAEETVDTAVAEAVDETVPEAVDDAVDDLVESPGPAPKKRKPRKRRVDAA